MAKGKAKKAAIPETAGKAQSDQKPSGRWVFWKIEIPNSVVPKWFAKFASVAIILSFVLLIVSTALATLRVPEALNVISRHLENNLLPSTRPAVRTDAPGAQSIGKSPDQQPGE